MADAATPITQRVRELYQRHIKFWQPYRDAMTKEDRFLAGERYEDDHGAYVLDRRLIQIRGQEIQDTIRHVSAKVTEKPRSVEARPNDQDDDPDAAEVAVSLIEHELSNPWKGFEDCYEEAIIACREHRLGVVWLDWDPECGAFGEMVYSYLDGRRLMWDPAYHPHHPLCGWLLREKRIDVELARDIYKAPWLVADRETMTSSGEYKPGVPLIRGADGTRLPDASSTYDDGKMSLWMCWYKNDRTYKQREKAGTRQGLKPEDRYLSCVGGCGYRSESQGALQEAGDLEGELPESGPGACPTCAGDLDRIDAKAEEELVRKFTKGRRFILMAPFSPSPDDEPLYDGGWPIVARSFPGLFLTSYVKPGAPMGPSDTTLMWDQQVASDNLRTIGVQRVMEHRNYWELPRTGITDYRGKRFNFREDQYNVMYRDGTVQMGPLNVRSHKSTGIDPNFAMVFQIAQDALTRYRPQLDVGTSQEQSKAIPVGTIERITQEAEVSTAHFKRRVNRELGKWYGVCWDFIRATYTAERLARLKLEGVDAVVGLHGDDLPNFDFVIEDTPQFTGLDKAKSDAFTGLMGAFQQAMSLGLDPLEMVAIYAQVNELPKSIVRRFTKMLAEAQAKAQAKAATAIPPLNGGGGGGVTGDGLPAEAGMNGGMNGGGIVPALQS